MRVENFAVPLTLYLFLPPPTSDSILFSSKKKKSGIYIMRKQKGELDKTLQDSLKIPICPGLVRVTVAGSYTLSVLQGCWENEWKIKCLPSLRTSVTSPVLALYILNVVYFPKWPS